MSLVVVTRESQAARSSPGQADQLIRTLPSVTRRISNACPTPGHPTTLGGPSYTTGNSGYPRMTSSTSSYAAVGIQAQPSTTGPSGARDAWALAFKAAREAAYMSVAARPNKQGEPEMEVVRPAFEHVAAPWHTQPVISPFPTARMASSHSVPMNKSSSVQGLIRVSSPSRAHVLCPQGVASASVAESPARARVLSPQGVASAGMTETPTRARVLSPQGVESLGRSARRNPSTARARVLSTSARLSDSPGTSVRCMSPPAKACVLSPSVVISGLSEPPERPVGPNASPARHVGGTASPAAHVGGTASPGRPRRMLSVPGVVPATAAAAAGMHESYSCSVPVGNSASALRVRVLSPHANPSPRSCILDPASSPTEVRLPTSPSLTGRASYGGSMSPRVVCVQPPESAKRRASRGGSKSPRVVRSPTCPPLISSVRFGDSTKTCAVRLQASPNMQKRLCVPIATPEATSRSPSRQVSTAKQTADNVRQAQQQPVFVATKPARIAMPAAAELSAALEAAASEAAAGDGSDLRGHAPPYERQFSTTSSETCNTAATIEPLPGANGPEVSQKLRSWNHLEPHVQVACHTISDALRNRVKLKRLVVQLFKRASAHVETSNDPDEVDTPSGADAVSSTTEATPASDVSASASFSASASELQKVEDMSLDIFGLTIFVDLLANHFDLPPYAFGNLEDAFVAYDFDGNGSLNVKEAYKFVKFQLEEYRGQLGGTSHLLEIPWTTHSEAGYEILHELGRGKFGIAKLAKHNDGKEVCIKVISKDISHKSRVEDMIEEYSAMTFLKCERIAGVQTIFQDLSFYYMVCDLQRGGDLLCLRQNVEKQGVLMTVDWWRQIFRQCVEALAYMHEQAIMHCDIKESNIMLKHEDCKEPQVIVIDLGVSMSCAKYDDGMISGTPGYVPPETLTNFKWYPRGDIFSLGVTIFQVVCGMVPPESGVFMDGCDSLGEVFKATMDREPPWERFPDDLGGLKDIVASMLEKERMRRPRAPQVLHDPWLTSADAESGDDSPHHKLYRRLKPKHHFATVGITRSMIARIEAADSEEDDTPPIGPVSKSCKF